MKKFKVLVVTAILTVTAVLALAVQPPPPVSVAATSFLETFDGTPGSPTGWSNPNSWDITPSGFNVAENGAPGQVAHHGPACQAPGTPYSSTNTHPMHSLNDAVFICNDHMMTSLGLTGYGAVYMTPPALADFSAGTSTISWDMSTLRTASRDWVYVTIMPFDAHNKFAYNQNDQAVPPDNVTIRVVGQNTMDAKQTVAGSEGGAMGNTYTTWDMIQAQNGVLNADGTPCNRTTTGGIDNNGTNGSCESAARRDHFVIGLSATHLSVCLTGNNAGQTYTTANRCWVDTNFSTPLASSTWHNQAVVMFTHVSYNPEKSCSDVEDSLHIINNPTGDANCPPNTWHWDNVSISPSANFSILNPTTLFPEFNDPNGVNTVTFPPAPAGTHLSYIGAGSQADQKFSLDGGATWTTAQLSASATPYHPDVGSEFWTSIPQGTTSVKFTGTRVYNTWGVFGISMWTSGGTPPPTHSPSASPTPSPTASPTASPTVTPLPQGGTITFNDLANPNRPLNGNYSVVNWGTGKWYVASPWGQFTTNSISYPNDGPTSATFDFLAPHVIKSLQAYTEGAGSSTVMVMCGSNPMVSQTISANAAPTTITTNWTVPCTTVTIGSTNSWNTNFDNFVY